MTRRRLGGEPDPQVETINVRRIRCYNPVERELMSGCSSKYNTNMAFVLCMRRFLVAVAFSFSVAIESVDGGTVALRARPAISQADTRSGYGRRRIMKDHRGLYLAGLQGTDATDSIIVERRYS